MAVLAGFLAVLFSGCVSEGETNQECDGEVCVTTPRPGDVFLTNATRPSILFDACWGAGLTTNVPPEWTDGVLPAAFEPGSGLDFTATTAQLEFLVLECPTLVAEKATGQKVRFMAAKMDAYPRDMSWQTLEHTEFIFDIYVSDADIHQQLVDLKLPAHLATIIDEPVTTPTGLLHRWSIQADGHEYSIPFYVLDGRSGELANPVYRWTGTDTFWRFDANVSTVQAGHGGIHADLVELGGDSAMRRILGQDAFVFRAQSYIVFDDEWRPYPTEFSR